MWTSASNLKNTKQAANSEIRRKYIDKDGSFKKPSKFSILVPCESDEEISEYENGVKISEGSSKPKKKVVPIPRKRNWGKSDKTVEKIDFEEFSDSEEENRRRNEKYCE